MIFRQYIKLPSLIQNIPMNTTGLLHFQIAHVQKMIECVLLNQCTLDASSTGTGKTYCSLKVCEHVGLRPFVICPKAVISNWINVAKYLNVKLLGVANYEKAKNGKYHDEKLRIIKGNFIKSKDDIFEINFPQDTIIIFDEAHKCKNWKTGNFQMMCEMRNKEYKLMLLSATITDKISCFRTFGYIFGLFQAEKKAYKLWMEKMINQLNLDVPESEQARYASFVIHTVLFPKFGDRMDIKDVSQFLPKNNIISNCYYTDNTDQINIQYDEINEAMKDLHNKGQQAIALVRILRARQKIELFKIPIFMELAQEAIESNFSVVIFVNFNQTMDYLCQELGCEATIRGGQSIVDIQKIIDDFQNNKKRLIIANISAGGVGISLDDTDGNYPRVSLISPTWSGQDLMQVLGRIYRANTKSNVTQKIIYCAGTYEETVCDCMTNKLQNLQTINEGDISGMNIPKELIDLKKED